MAEALVKQITGGDPIRARRMREDFWTFMPSHKIWLAANHKPVVKGTDYAIWRRIRLIPFTVTITEPDPHFGDKLRAEYAGILAWAVRGCLLWQKEGLSAPSAVLDASAGYRREMDVLATFLADCCVLDINARVGVAALYKVYRAWCETNGERYETQRMLGGRLKERGVDQVRGTGGLYVWIGLGLRATGEASDVSDVSDVTSGMF